MAVSENKKALIVSLRAQGLSFATIADQAKVAKQTAVDIVGENRDQIETLKAIAMEELYESTRISTRSRLEQMANIQSRLLTEIEARDLTELPTDKLITLYLNLNKSLKEEIAAPTIRTTEEQRDDLRKRTSFLNW